MAGLDRRTRIRLAALLVVSALICIAYVVRWVEMDHSQIVRSDYITQLTGSTLWRTGQGANLYSDQAQAAVYSKVVGADHSGVILFQHAPLSAVLSAPFSLLSTGAGYRAWTAIQLLAFVAGVLLVARAAPWPKATPALLCTTVVAAALAGIPTLALFLEGQDIGLQTLGLAIFYWLWTRGNTATASFVLAFSACVCKPHLFLAVAIWFVARRDWRSVSGAVGGVAVGGLLSLVLVGPAAVTGFVEALWRFTGNWSSLGPYGFTGIFVGWFGETTTARVVASVVGLLAVATAWSFGRSSRKVAIEPWFTLALAASLVASPHLNAHDLALLALALVWSTAWALEVGPPRLWGWIVSLYLGLQLAIAIDYSGVSVPRFVGEVTPFVLGGIVFWAWWFVHRRGPRALDQAGVAVAA